MHIDIEQLSCSRGHRVLFSDVTFRAAAGTCILLTGANGTGKTTLLRAIAGFVEPVAGSIRFADGPPDVPQAELLHLVGHRSGVKDQLTVYEHLAFWSTYLSSAPTSAGTRGSIEVAMRRLGLERLADLRAMHFSAGQRRRLALARLLVAPRPVWLLDEPTTSLDSQGAAVVTTLIEEHLSGGGIVIAATHQDLGLGAAQKIHLDGAVAQEVLARTDLAQDLLA